MKSYSEDLRRKKIVAAVERGMSKTAAARLFDVSLSPGKALLKDGPSGELARSKEETRQDSKGRREGQDATQRRHERAPRCDPIAERICFLQSITGERLSYSTILRLLKRIGWSRKKGVWVQQNETSGSEPPGG